MLPSESHLIIFYFNTYLPDVRDNTDKTNSMNIQILLMLQQLQNLQTLTLKMLVIKCHIQGMHDTYHR